MMTTICLLISPSEESGALAESVGQLLTHKFAVDRVVIRSADTPVVRLLTFEPHLFAVLGSTATSTTSPTTAAILESESSVPVLVVAAPRDSTAFAAALQIAKFASLASKRVQQAVALAVQQQRQDRMVQDAQLRTSSPYYRTNIEHATLITGDAVAKQVPGCIRGKVRDRYNMGTTNNNGTIALVTTDRQSGFDRQLAMIPYKGAVLNLTSAFWFQQTAHIIPNHMVAVPHPNVLIATTCKPFPIEFVVRAYMTGSTSTSIWKNYQNGVRNYCGHVLPDHMTKNQKLERILLTPTTKEDAHDRPISLTDVVLEQWMTQDDLNVCAKAALAIFELGQQVAADHGLILVDTKYEFGRSDGTGQIMLIDEVHTPDSSRYWLASTYEQRIAEGQEPDNIDKEFLRLWFSRHCDPYKDEVLPEAPRDLVLELARRYITLYEMITWKDFDFDAATAAAAVHGEDAIVEAIQANIKR